MYSTEAGLSVSSLADVALLASRVGRIAIENQTEPSSASLREFWQQSRELQQMWTLRLDQWTPASDPELRQLGELATQVFGCELMTRVWSTVLLGIDRQTGRDDLSRIARNAVSGLLQVRHGVMSRLLQLPESATPQITEIERFRRRCDRWTDFALESIEFDPSTGPHPVEHLVAAGLKMAFLGQLPESQLTNPAFQRLVQSILGALTQNAFHEDGSVRSLLERRVSSRVLREKMMPASLLGAIMVSDAAAQLTEPRDTIPFPGINFTQIRRRPK